MQLQAGVGFFRPKTTHPLACNCETGWVSCSFSLRQRTTTSHVGSSSSSAPFCPPHNDDDNPPPRLQLRDGVDPFLLFKATNDDEPCRLVVVICLCLHPPQRRRYPTPSLAIARWGGSCSFI